MAIATSASPNADFYHNLGFCYRYEALPLRFNAGVSPLPGLLW